VAQRGCGGSEGLWWLRGVVFAHWNCGGSGGCGVSRVVVAQLVN
jgi:hypothetical protein